MIIDVNLVALCGFGASFARSDTSNVLLPWHSPPLIMELRIEVILSSDALSINKRRKEWNSLPTRRKKRNVVTISITFNYILIIEVEKELNAAASADSLHSLAHGNC